MYYVCKNTRVHLYVVCSPIVFNVHILHACTVHTYLHVHHPPPPYIYSIMFWTDDGNDPKIKRARMDGTLETTIFRQSGSFSNFIHPNDVAIDYNTDFLYFVEGVSGSLSVSTFNGNGRRSLISKDTDSSYIKKPRSLTIRHISEQYQDGDQRTEESIVFWSDPDLRVISRADIVTEGGSTANVRRSNLRWVLPKETEYVPYAVQFVSMHGHREGGERGCWLCTCICTIYVCSLLFLHSVSCLLPYLFYISHFVSCLSIVLPSTAIPISFLPSSLPPEITGLATGPCSPARGSCEYLCIPINATHRKCACPDDNTTTCREGIRTTAVVRIANVNFLMTPTVCAKY